jgi:hypothetical protein
MVAGGLGGWTVGGSCARVVRPPSTAALVAASGPARRRQKPPWAPDEPGKRADKAADRSGIRLVCSERSRSSCRWSSSPIPDASRSGATRTSSSMKAALFSSLADPSPLRRPSEPDERHLRWVDYAEERLRPRLAHARYRDRPVGHLRAAQPPGAGPRHHVPHRRHQIIDPKRLRVPDGRCDQPAAPERHRHPGMDGIRRPGRAVEVAIHFRDRPRRRRHRLDEERGSSRR